MAFARKRILVIDDTASIRIFLRISLEAHGIEFYEASSAKQGMNLCQTMKPDLVVLDLGLPDKDGLEILPDIKRIETMQKASPKVVILSVRKEQKTKEKAKELGADAYLSKPFLMEDLLEIIETVMDGGEQA